jgi:hypothetical protein
VRPRGLGSCALRAEDIPESMIAKRVNRGERIEFVSFFESVIAQVNQMKQDPEYQR